MENEDWREIVRSASEKVTAHRSPKQRLCFYCSESLDSRPKQTKMCVRCSDKRFGVRNKAVVEVYQAVQRGWLPRANTQICVDCGKPAHNWDHRDYRKPMQIEPVCRSCNGKRTPALF